MSNDTNNKKLEVYLKNIFLNTLEVKEGKLFTLFSLYFELTHSKSYVFLSTITPKNRKYIETYVYLFFLCKSLKIEINLTLNHTPQRTQNTNTLYTIENPIYHDFPLTENIPKFIESPLFFNIDEKAIEYYCISLDFSTDKNIQKIKEHIEYNINKFLQGDLEKQFNIFSYTRQKDILLTYLEMLDIGEHSIFEVKEENFWIQGKKDKFAYIHFLIFLYISNYIDIYKFEPVNIPKLFSLNKENGKTEVMQYSFLISIESKLKELLHEWGKLKAELIDRAFDNEYQKFTILKKGGKLKNIDGKREYLGDYYLFVELKNKFQNARIEADVYKNKINKYTVIERIKLE